MSALLFGLLADTDCRLRAPHFPGGGAAQKLLALITAMPKLKPDPLGQVMDRRIDGAGGSDVIRAAIFNDAKLAVGLIMGGGKVGPGLERNDAGIADHHSQRREDPFFDKIVPALAGDCVHDLSGGKEHYVLISKPGPEAGGGLEKADAAYHFISVIGRVVPDQISAKGLEPAAVREQIANGHFAGHVRVIHLEPGKVHRDWIIPFHLALVDQRSEE